MSDDSRVSPHSAPTAAEGDDRFERFARLGDLAEAVQELARRLQNLDHADSADLAPVERMVMHQIDLSPGTTPGAIAAELRLKTSNTAAALRNLEERGFLTRTRDADDRRVVRLHATEAAHRNLDRVRAAWATALEPVFPAQVDPAELVRQLTLIHVGLSHTQN